MFMLRQTASVPVECLFSTTGLIMNSKCSSLSPHKLNMITFVHDKITRTCNVTRRPVSNYM